jgi:hypothetical protein
MHQGVEAMHARV